MHQVWNRSDVHTGHSNRLTDINSNFHETDFVGGLGPKTVILMIMFWPYQVGGITTEKKGQSCILVVLRLDTLLYHGT